MERITGKQRMVKDDFRVPEARKNTEWLPTPSYLAMLIKEADVFNVSMFLTSFTGRLCPRLTRR